MVNPHHIGGDYGAVSLRRILRPMSTQCDNHYFEVEYPSKPSEADVVFELCKQLESIGVQVKQEVKLKLPGFRGCRFDVVCYKNNKAFAIIEAKRTNGSRAYKKLEYYKDATGLPVLLCGGMSGIGDTICRVRTLLTSA